MTLYASEIKGLVKRGGHFHCHIKHMYLLTKSNSASRQKIILFYNTDKQRKFKRPEIGIYRPPNLQKQRHSSTDETADDVRGQQGENWEEEIEENSTENSKENSVEREVHVIL